MSRNSCDVGTGAISFHVVFMFAVWFVVCWVLVARTDRNPSCDSPRKISPPDFPDKVLPGRRSAERSLKGLSNADAPRCMCQDKTLFRPHIFPSFCLAFFAALKLPATIHADYPSSHLLFLFIISVLSCPSTFHSPL
jgi:hypothetical protein